MRSIGRWLLEPPAKAFRWFFDPRFHQLETRLMEATNSMEQRLERTSAGLDAHGAAMAEVLAFLGQRSKQLAETTAVQGERLEGVEGQVQEALGLLKSVLKPASSLAELDARGAAFLNRAGAHDGLAAEAGLWFNPPITVRFTPGGAEVGDVNERIVEVPFALQVIGALPSGSRILDVGSTESTVAFSLASLGYRVTGIDLHPYRLEHSNLETVTAPLEDWEGPEASFDAVLCLSSIEHFGLGAYGEEPKEGLDREAMKKLRTLVKPGGLLVFTAPFGEYEVGDFQRTYDRKALFELLEGWEIGEVSFALQRDASHWEVIGGLDRTEEVLESGRRAVVLITAHEGQPPPSA